MILEIEMGKITASCGHTVSVAELVSVELDGNGCETVEGSQPGTVHAVYCRECANDLTANKQKAAINLAYGLLFHMQIDLRDDNLRLAADARKALLAVMTSDDRADGITRAKMTDARFTSAA